MLIWCPKCLTLRGEVGGKACDAPLVAEKANRVWRSGRLFARIRAEKDGNRKRKRDTAHDGVGSSGQGEPFKHCNRSAFLLSKTHLTLSCEVGGKACDAPPVAEEANRVWYSGRLFAGIRAEKDGNRKWKRDTAHDAVGSSGAGGVIQALQSQCFFLSKTHLTLSCEVGGKA